MQRPGLQSRRTLQSFEQRNVFGDIVVLMADPFGDSDFAVVGTVDDTSTPDGLGFPREPLSKQNRNFQVQLRS
jgi:hypothetical protein